jgi:hypothetical protein
MWRSSKVDGSMACRGEGRSEVLGRGRSQVSAGFGLRGADRLSLWKCTGQQLTFVVTNEQ